MSPSPVRGLRRRLRSRLAAIGAAALLVAVAGCSALGGSEAPEQTTPGTGGIEQPNIKMGILPIADSAAEARALNAGYFAEEGLNVELVEFPSGVATMQTMLAGDIDVGYINWPSIFVATVNNGGEFKIFFPGSASGQGTFLLLTPPDSTIKTPADLPGKRVAINTLRSINEILLRSSMETNGVDPNSVELVDMAFPDMLPALQNKQVDAAVMVEPFITQASKAIGAVTILDVASGPTAEIPTSGGATTAQWAAENPNTMAALERAMAKATADLSDRAIVEQTLLTYTKIDAATASLISLPVYLPSLDTIRLQRMADLMLQYGVLPQPVDVAPLLDVINSPS